MIRLHRKGQQIGLGSLFVSTMLAEAQNVIKSKGKMNGVDVVYGPLIQEAYQMNEFAIRDCDGHVLGFGQALDR